MKVKSFYENGTHTFVIEKFSEVIEYIDLLSVINKYYFIITTESQYEIEKINILLTTSSKHKINNTCISFVGTNDSHFNWCNNIFNCITIDALSKIINKKYNTLFDIWYPKQIEKPSWIFEDKSLINFYYVDNNIKILIVESIEQNWHLISKYTNNMYIFMLFPSHYNKYKFQLLKNAIYSENKTLNHKNCIMMCQNLDYILLSCEHGFSYILLNQNALLDYNIFTHKHENKIYDAVINCRPENWKRPFLAKTVEKLAVLKGYNFRKNDYYDLNQLVPKFINQERLTPEQVNDIYNKSICGLIFSESEGACYSSGEYLLAGLPVISTTSTGGRDIWYTINNSIIVEPDDNAVKNAIEICKEYLINGKFNPIMIRDEHIEISNKMRNNFINYVQFIFDSNDINLNSCVYWNGHYYNKMRSTQSLQNTLVHLMT